MEKSLSLEMLRKTTNMLREQRVKEPYYVIHSEKEVKLLMDLLEVFEPVSYLANDRDGE